MKKRVMVDDVISARERLFKSEAYECEWLMSFLQDMLNKSKTEKIKEFYLQELNKALLWKRELFKTGKFHPPVNYKDSDTIPVNTVEVEIEDSNL